MGEFLKAHRKGIKIGFIVFFVIIILISVWLFIMPSFKRNKYGDRLKDISKHKISNEVINKIKDKANDNDSVKKIDYNREGRILSFIITVDSNFGVDQAKEFAKGILDEISDDNKKYYDIQVLITSDEKSDNYPIAGYKNKNSEEFKYGNAGGN